MSARRSDPPSASDRPPSASDRPSSASDRPLGAFQRRSATFFVYLHQLPRWVPLVVLPALLIAGLAVPGPVGGVLLALLAFVLWFAFMAVPARSASHRAIRLVIPLIILVGAVLKLTS